MSRKIPWWERLSLRHAAYVLLCMGILFALWFLIFGGYFKGSFWHPDAHKADAIQHFVGGIVLPLLTLGSTLLVIETLRLNGRQNFSNTFFKLIDQHHKLIDNIDTTVTYNGNEITNCKGRGFFDDLSMAIAEAYHGRKPIKKDLKDRLNGKAGQEKLLEIFDYYYQIHQSDIGHYFRNLFHIIKYIDNSHYPDDFKLDHIRFLRAQLSNYEILLLAYNGMHRNGRNFIPMIERYNLMKNLNLEDGLSNNWVKRIIDVAVLEEVYPSFKRVCDRKRALNNVQG
jgi:hypothetical protein